MKMKLKNESFFYNRKWGYIILIIGLWMSFAAVAHYVLSCDFFSATNGNKEVTKSYIDYLEAFYVAAGALFTGLAFAVTLRSLIHQHRETQEQNSQLSVQISLDVFSDAFGHVLDSEDFREAKKYIYSSQFEEDIDTLVSIHSQRIRLILIGYKDMYAKKIHEVQTGHYNEDLSHQKMAEVEKEYIRRLAYIRQLKGYKEIIDKLSIEDFRKIVVPIKRNVRAESGGIKNTYVSYERIRYFCDRMEYLGSIYFAYNHYLSTRKIVRDGDQQYVFLDYFGYEIISSYDKVAPFIKTSQKEKGQGNGYYHYTYLYKHAKQREDEYIKTMKEILNELN